VRAVFDTNVLISAFVFPGGPPEFAFRAALSGRIALITSPPLLAEFGRVLGQKFGWEDEMVEAAVGQVARIGAVVRPATRVSVINEDPADDRVLEAAQEGGVDVIVSGDRHLLRLGRWRDIRIVRVTELVAELER
jgi:putative PIN family toxin of toxin-antitoxin system